MGPAHDLCRPCRWRAETATRRAADLAYLRDLDDDVRAEEAATRELWQARQAAKRAGDRSRRARENTARMRAEIERLRNGGDP